MKITEGMKLKLINSNGNSVTKTVSSVSDMYEDSFKVKGSNSSWKVRLNGSITATCSYAGKAFGKDKQFTKITRYYLENN